MKRWLRAIAESEVKDGWPVSCEIEEREIALYRVGEQVFATDNLCTHGYARLCDGYQQGFIIECPLHQGQFDVRSGACVAEPATENLGAYPVRIVEGFIEVQVD